MSLPNIHKRTKSSLSGKKFFETMRQSIDNEEVFQGFIKNKIHSYVTCRPTMSRLKNFKVDTKAYEFKMRIYQNSSDIPKVTSLKSLIQKEKQFAHTYKQKMEINYQQCFLFYMQILSCSIQYELKISKESISKEKSVLIDCLQFIAESLFQIGTEKLAFFFSAKAVRLCQIMNKNLQLGKFLFLMGKIARKLNRFQTSIIFLKKGIQYLWQERKQQAFDIQTQIYDQLSHNFLQMNMLEQSNIFAKKYQIGYVQKNNSKIIQLSKQLVLSVQKRRAVWHGITKQSMQLLLTFNIDELMKEKKSAFSGKIDQKRLMQVFKIHFDYLWDSFLQDDMFFYEIPLPLQIISPEKPKSIMKVKHAKSSQKFISHRRSSSTDKIKIIDKNSTQKAKQYIIFNYRGVGVSKQKLVKKFTTFVQKLKQVINFNK